MKDWLIGVIWALIAECIVSLFNDTASVQTSLKVPVLEVKYLERCDGC